MQKMCYQFMLKEICAMITIYHTNMNRQGNLFTYNLIFILNFPKSLKIKKVKFRKLLFLLKTMLN